MRAAIADEPQWVDMLHVEAVDLNNFAPHRN
jgi:hypothetical protein